jgi:hypothetical protein
LLFHVLLEQGGGPEKKQASLLSDNVTGKRVWHSREIKLRRSLSTEKKKTGQ